jgi:hypothetical protein
VLNNSGVHIIQKNGVPSHSGAVLCNFIPARKTGRTMKVSTARDSLVRVRLLPGNNFSVSCRWAAGRCLAEKGGSRTLRESYDPQTGFEDQRHHRAPSFSDKKINNLGGHPGLFINLLVKTRAGATSPQRLPRALYQCPRRPRSESRCMLQTAS